MEPPSSLRYLDFIRFTERAPPDFAAYRRCARSIGGLVNTLFARSSICDAILGTADQNSGAKDQKTSDEHLERCPPYRRIHPAVANEGNDGEFNYDNTRGNCCRCPEVCDEIGKCVAKTAERSHET